MQNSNMKTAFRMIQLVRPLAIPMSFAVILGILGFLAAIAIPVSGTALLLSFSGFQLPVTNSLLYVIIIASALLRGFLRYGEQLLNHFIAFKLLAIIRDMVFKALRRLAPAKLETKEKGDLVAVITSDIELLEVFYAHTVSPVLIAVLTCLILLGFFYRIHPLFAAIAFTAYLTIGFVLPLAVSKAGRKTGQEYRKKSGALSGYMLESLRGIQEIIQYAQGDKRLSSIQEKTEDLCSCQSQLARLEGLSSSIANTAILLFSLSILFGGILLYNQGSIPLLSAILAFVGMISSFGPVLALSSLANNLVHTFAAGKRVFAILDEKPQTEDILEGCQPEFNSLSLDNVTFGYDKENILSGLSLSLQRGKTLGISGKSGSGKSTLLRLLMRFWDIKQGSILVSGHDLNTIHTEKLRDMQSFVTQETQLFQDTIENNIRIAKLDATAEEIEAACRKAALHEFIMTLPEGYKTSLTELGDSLSGGERQRMGLARAFLHDADVLLLDEPTSNLDTLNEGIILKSLNDYADTKTVILVSHRRSTLSIADQKIHLESGRIS